MKDKNRRYIILGFILFLFLTGSLVTIFLFQIQKEKQYMNIYHAASLYVIPYRSDYYAGQEIMISIYQLQQSGYLKKDMKNPKTGKLFSQDDYGKLSILSDYSVNYDLIGEAKWKKQLEVMI